MTTAFPTAIDNFTNPTATDALDSVTVPHASQHANINDAVEAIETAIGTTGAPVLAKINSPTFTGTVTIPSGASIADYAPIASPTFTGVPAAPTAAVATNTTQVATTAFVQASKVYFGLTTGLYYSTLRTQTAGVTAGFQTVFFTPISFDTTETFDRIAITTRSTYSGTGAVRLGIYNNDSTTGKPTTVVLDAGTVATTALSTNYEITISQSLSPGAYWLAFCVQTAPTAANFFGMAIPLTLGYDVTTGGTGTPNAGAWTQTGVSGAFATAGTLVSTATPVSVALRAS